jgi:hypothetical protein
VRRVLVHDGNNPLYNQRVEIHAPPFLTAFNLDRTNLKDLAAELKQYSDVIRDFARELPNRFCVFHDRANTLAALRLALPIELSFNIGLHMHLRNDALRRGGKNLTRSRHRVVLFENLWQPLLKGMMPRSLQ